MAISAFIVALIFTLLMPWDTQPSWQAWARGAMFICAVGFTVLVATFGLVLLIAAST